MQYALKDGENLQNVRKNINRVAIVNILLQRKKTSTTSFALNGPAYSRRSSWFKPKPWVTDTGLSKIYAEFRVNNIGLGNRGPALNGKIYKMCPLCRNIGKQALNNEVKRMQH